MSSINSMLKTLAAELSTAQVRTTKGVTGVSKVYVERNGDLVVKFRSGDSKVFSGMGKWLNESNIAMTTRVVQFAKKRGLFSGVMSFFRWLAICLILIAIAALVLIFVGTKYLWDAFTGKN